MSSGVGFNLLCNFVILVHEKCTILVFIYCLTGKDYKRPVQNGRRVGGGGASEVLPHTKRGQKKMKLC